MTEQIEFESEYEVDDFFLDSLTASLEGIITTKFSEPFVEVLSDLKKGVGVEYTPSTVDSPLLSTLACVGIFSEGKYAPEFFGDPTLLMDVGHCPALWYKDDIVINIEYADIGASVLTHDKVTGLVVPYANTYYGNAFGDKYCLGARQKIDGTLVVVFKIITLRKNYFFSWSAFGIRECDIKSEGTFEMYDGKLYSLTGPICDFGEVLDVVTAAGNMTLPLVDHNYEALTQELVQENLKTEGLIINLNAVEYKCPNKRVVTLRRSVRDTVSYMDSNGNSYKTNGFSSSDFSDFVYDDGVFTYLRDRDDKLSADSASKVKEIVGSMVITKDLLSYAILPRVKKRIEWSSRFNIRYADNFEQKIALMNAGHSAHSTALFFLLEDRGKYSFMDMHASWFTHRTLNKRERENKKENNWGKRTYHVTVKTFISSGYYMSNVFFPSSVGVHSIEEGRLVPWFVRDVPGYGLRNVVFVGKRDDTSPVQTGLKFFLK